MPPTIGVLALQGAFAAHRRLLAEVDVPGGPLVTTEVRSVVDLAGIDALVMPGGESTTMSMLLVSSGLFEGIDSAIRSGMPVFGTCAGMILLASEVLDGRPDQRCLDAVDISVRRNGYGRQVDSFEADLHVAGLADLGGEELFGHDRFHHDRFHGVFIRAPKVERCGPAVDVLATHEDVPVLVRQGAVTVASFHPELTGDHRLHSLFIQHLVTEAR